MSDIITVKIIGKVNTKREGVSAKGNKYVSFNILSDRYKDKYYINAVTTSEDTINKIQQSNIKEGDSVTIIGSLNQPNVYVNKAGENRASIGCFIDKISLTQNSQSGNGTYQAVQKNAPIPNQDPSQWKYSDSTIPF